VAKEVVARYIDGRVVKGTSQDIDPNRPFCHVRTSENGVVQVKLVDLKALFFVRDLIGDPDHDDDSTLAPNDMRARGAHPIEVEFADGERVVGLTASYPPVRPFYFVLPVDQQSNNVRILVNRAAVTRIGRQLDPTS
jgi:hypothetical protein